MPKLYSQDPRERVIETWKRDQTNRDALAGQFSTGVAMVNQWIARYRSTRGVEPKPHGGGRVAALDETGLAAVKRLVDEKRDRTGQELVVLLRDRHDLSVIRSVVIRALKRPGHTRKKSIVASCLGSA
jgi:transposase